jgi:hypothetical protein
MMRTRERGARCAWALAGCLLAAAAAPLPAQETPPPAAEGVKLVYKFQPGTARRRKGNATVDATVSLEGAGAGMGPIPMTMKMTVGTIEKITGVKDGVATIATQMDTMTLTTNTFGTSVAMKMVGGKTSVTVNGQPTKNPNAVAALKKQFGSGLVTRRDARGNETAVSGPEDLRQTLGGGSASSLQFPENPIKVGESWETTQKVKPTVPGGFSGSPAAGGNLTTPEFEVKMTHTLRAVEVKNGKQFALIDSIGSGEAPTNDSGPVQSLSQSFTGTTRFDMARGVIVSGQYSSDLGMKMAMPAVPGGGAPGAAPGGGNMPSGVRIDGAIKANLSEAPAAPVKPAARKPVKRKR